MALLLAAAVTVTVVPLTLHAAAITVADTPCSVAIHTGVVYVCPSVIVQVVPVDMEHVPPVEPAADCTIPLCVMPTGSVELSEGTPLPLVATIALFAGAIKPVTWLLVL